MVVAELQMPPAGDYIRNALKGQEFYKGSQPRWEALCGIIGFAELYHATGEADLSTAYQQIWWCAHPAMYNLSIADRSKWIPFHRPFWTYFE
jgi:hypothetical protein